MVENSCKVARRSARRLAVTAELWQSLSCIAKAEYAFATSKPLMTTSFTKKRVAVVVQRYGEGINGGAELHARMLVNTLSRTHEVDVLTSRAHDYSTWSIHYPADNLVQTDCRVLRFDHPQRDSGSERRMPLGSRIRWRLRAGLSWVMSPLVQEPCGDEHTDGIRCLRAQGPTMDGLMDYLREQGAKYRALIFMTALYHPTAMGVLIHPERSILVPTLHDEKMMYLPHFHRVFKQPRWILFNTSAEAEVAKRLYGKGLAPAKVCGVGVDLPPAEDSVDQAQIEWREIAKRYGIQSPYLLYLGRVDTSKGCGVLFKHHLRRVGQHPTAPVQLVVAGQAFMQLPQDPSIVCTGFVSDRERDVLLSHAAALVVPSRYESLSLVVLEAMARGTPTIVNRSSEVLMQHVTDSHSGYAYANFSEFKKAVDAVLSMPGNERSRHAQRARLYVEERYTWSKIRSILVDAIDSIDTAPPTTHAVND